MTAENEKHAIVLFDGVCSLCSRSVQFIIKRDRRGYFRFASLQSDTGKRLLADRPDFANGDSLVLIENGRYYRESSAVLRIARRLDGIWKSAVVGIAVPRPLRDALYQYMARNRYRWFGRQEACMLPSAKQRERFL
jgi:predicted DCC family thiol-disulfide oxidoreductase YuxK